MTDFFSCDVTAVVVVNAVVVMDAAVSSSGLSNGSSYQFIPRSLVRPIQPTAAPMSTPFKSRFLAKHQKSDPDRASASPDRSISSARPGNTFSLTNYPPRFIVGPSIEDYN